MENQPELNPGIRELCHREPLDGLEKFLFWHSDDNTLSVIIRDEKEKRMYAFQVPNDKGLEAFKHPFAYMPDGCEGVELP